MSDNFINFCNSMNDERHYQAKKWGDGTIESLAKVDDDNNSLNDFVAYIANHSTRWFTGGFPPYNDDVLEAYQKQMVKVAALAFAGHEFAERAKNGADSSQ